MPITTTGERAEILLNPLGVINRLNPAQLMEQHINFMSDHVVKIMKSKETYREKADVFFTYLREVAHEEFNYFDLEYIMMNRVQQEQFIDDIEKNGIYIHQAPFFGNTTEEEFLNIQKNHPEWTEPYEFEGIEQPMVMGDVYFIRLTLAYSLLNAGNSERTISR